MTAVAGLTIDPAMPFGGPPSWQGATWIGGLDLEQLGGVSGPHSITLGKSAGYRRARLLVREHGRVRGGVEVPVEAGTVAVDAVLAAVAELPPSAGPRGLTRTGSPPVTVAVSTRNRPEHLAALLPSLADLRGVAEVLIVDNASQDDQTELLVESSGIPGVRYVREERVGLSYGRNRALLEARTPVVAFTDDDVVVDPGWVEALSRAFLAAGDVAVVCGMVSTGELRTPAQQYFEKQTGWQQAPSAEVYRRTDVRPDIANFPLDVGRYGTGANFAVRRDLVVRLGGFNEALGIGSPSRGGEDLDLYVRALFAGFAVAVVPDAIVWHRHRADLDELESAVDAYATSWTAWMTSLLELPEVRVEAVRLGLRHLARRASAVARSREAAVTDERAVGLGPRFDHLARVGARGLLKGPAAYIRSRRSGRAIRPLLGAEVSW